MRGGIVLDYYGRSQLSLTIADLVFKIHNMDEYYDVIVFYGSHDIMIHQPSFALMLDYYMWGYKAPVVATSLQTAEKLLNCPNPNPKYLWMWNLEWMYTQYDIHYLDKIYNHPDLNLICRTQEHYDIVKHCWKEPTGIITDDDHTGLARLFAKQNRHVPFSIEG